MNQQTNPIRTHSAKIGQHRGNARLWIEGAYLVKAGFVPGESYSVVVNGDGSLTITPGEGDRKVSGKRKGASAVLDICNSATLGKIAECARVDIVTAHGKITVTPAKASARIAARVATMIAIALYAGGGLLCEAAAHAGYQTVAAIESNEVYAETWQANHNGHMVAQDIADVDFGSLSADVADRHGAVGLLTVGQPCEAFSQIRRTATDGKSKADSSLSPESHSGGDLFVHTIRAVEAFNPHTVVIECVPAFLESVAGIVTRSVLERWGYTVDSKVIEPDRFGEPTTRKRAVMIARTGADPVWPEETGSVRTMADVLLDADDDRCEWWDDAHPIKRHGGVPWPIARGAAQKAKGNGFACPVLTTETATCPALTKRYFAGQGSNPIVEHPRRPGLYRWLSIDEARRIMGVPDTYVLPSAKLKAGEVLGQGVVVDLFRRVIAAQAG